MLKNIIVSLMFFNGAVAFADASATEIPPSHTPFHTVQVAGEAQDYGSDDIKVQGEIIAAALEDLNKNAIVACGNATASRQTDFMVHTQGCGCGRCMQVEVTALYQCYDR